MADLALHPVGVVRSPVTDRKDMPPLGVPAAVEIFPEFSDGLLHLEKHSHIWVLAWLDQTGRGALQVTPRGVRDQGAGGLHGVFAVRSPTRPNPIGLTAARILSRSGNRIELDRLDFSDGTLVVDLKPYFSTRDMIFSARNAQVGKPASIQAVRESLLMQALQFCGAPSPDLELAVEICTRFRTEVLDFNDPPQWDITVPSSRPQLADAFMGITRVSLGQGSLRLHSEPTVVFVHEGRRYDYALP
ncbi:MAG: tRNA (N6-threonylcarbamoyladenosine(37)-N6)-methyltransferase TrmO [Acidobacteriia bacterium]|nr:tRNA (N6-threonylcarbamoyladenosine(37)-N6)-methyltransferase TrmO [Terriglobia bacterium]